MEVSSAIEHVKIYPVFKTAANYQHCMQCTTIIMSSKYLSKILIRKPKKDAFRVQDYPGNFLRGV